MIISHNTKEIDLLARIMRAEAIGEGDLGMLMVGNVIANRVIGSCMEFKNIRSLTDAIYQKNQFSGTSSSLFNGGSTTKEKDLAKRIIKGEYYHPATNALWFYAPSKGTECKTTWYNQAHSGKYKNHCFYKPDPGECKDIY